MDEFRKPYEYEEDKGISGLLLVYFFMLLAEESLLGVIVFFFGYSRLPENKWFNMILICMAVFYTLFSVFSAIVLKLEKKCAVKVSKIFLIYRFAFMVPYLIFNTNIRIAEIPYSVGYELYERAYHSIINSFIISVSYIVIFSVGWYIYLIRSRKVKEIFADNAPSHKAAVQ